MKKVGSTILIEPRVGISGYGSSVGKKEGEGPLGGCFDKVHRDTTLKMSSWEQAEAALLTEAIDFALGRAGLNASQIDAVFTGDLLDQCIASTLGTKSLGAPHIGLFGACSTMALSLALAALAVSSGAMSHALAATCSHFCSAERQFRFPLEYGGKRTPTSQWTVTGAGAAVVSGEGELQIRSVCFGKIIDLGIKDANNMGAAMAPAACDTIVRYFRDTGSRPEDFDLILTGDLGQVGSSLLYELAHEQGYNLKARHNDCGMMIYNADDFDVSAGGSGCGCSGAVLCSAILNRMRSGEFKRLLFIATGALMSPTSNQQGMSIPSVAHLVELQSAANG